MENSKLSQVDKSILEKLIDPDQQVQAKYQWDEDFQRVLMGMLLSNRFFLSQSVGLVKPNYFFSEVHQLSCRILLEYFHKYKQLPSKIWMKQAVTDSLREKYQNQDNDTFLTVKLLYTAELNTVYDFYARGGVGDMMPDLDSTEAILDKITAFAKERAVKFAVGKILELVRKAPEAESTWSSVGDIFKEAMLVGPETDLGLDYFNTIEDRYARMANAQETAETFTTGFETIDRSLHGGGLYRGELGAWMGLPGTGKSLALVVASVKNIAKGKKVLYISTEMDKDRIAERFDCQLSLVGQHELLARKEEVWAALRDEVRDYEDKRRLVIKQFPSGTADVNTVRAFHSQCVMNGFRPDIMVVDYPGDMKHPASMPLHQSMQRMCTELRGFGVEEQHLTLVAIQPNRGPSGEMTVNDYMDENRQGDSFGQNRVLDAFWTLNQTAHEQKAALGRVFIAKARNGKSRFSFKIKYGFPTQTLTMEEISDGKYADIMSRIKDTDAGEVVIDKVSAVVKPFEPSEGERVS